jgi:hypothetical protein
MNLRNMRVGMKLTQEQLRESELELDAPYFEGGMIYRDPKSKWRSFVVNQVQRNGRRVYEVIRILNSGT